MTMADWGSHGQSLDLPESLDNDSAKEYEEG